VDQAPPRGESEKSAQALLFMLSICEIPTTMRGIFFGKTLCKNKIRYVDKDIYFESIGY
jgi:hypothetical protein